MSTTPAYLFTRRHVSVVFESGAGSTQTLRPGPGDWSHSGFEAGLVESVPVLDHGQYLESVEGDDIFMTGSLTVKQGSADFGVYDAVMKDGTFSSEATTDPGGVVWMGNLIVTLTRGGTTKTFKFFNCRFTMNLAAAKEGNDYAISYVVYGKSDGTKLELT